MALPQAQLGSMPSISLGGYIPAARNDPSLLEQALMAFLGGAAGTAGNRLVDKALPDPQRVASQKLAQDQLAAQIENNKAVVALGKDRNVTDNRGLTIQEKNAIAERQLKEKLATEERLYNYFRGAEKNAIDMTGLQNTDENTKTNLRQQAQRDKDTNDARLLDSQIRAVGTTAGARVNNAQADGLETQNNAFTTQQKQRDAAALLGKQVKLENKPGTADRIGQYLANYMSSEYNPIYAMTNPMVEAIQEASFNPSTTQRVPITSSGPAPQAVTNQRVPINQQSAPVEAPRAPQQTEPVELGDFRSFVDRVNEMSQEPPAQIPGPPTSQGPHEYTPEEIEAMKRRIEMMANQPLSAPFIK